MSARTLVTRARWIAGLLVLLGLFVGGTAAYANNGPHGNYERFTTGKCAACHRAHTARGTELLTYSTIYGLCTSCHGSGSSTTNVLDGIGADGRLNGGGFVDLGGKAATSTHAIAGLGGSVGMGTAWGGGTTGPGIGMDTVLECTSCHNPHGSNNYRILRDATDPQWTAEAATWTVVGGQVDPGSQTYTTPGGFQRWGMVQWCSTCHTQYMNRTSVYDAGDGKGSITRYRHSVAGGNPNCLTCHFAHGTTAAATGYAKNVAPTNDSALLRYDNRGICTTCHLDDQNRVTGGSCDSCHGAPPDTAAHKAHVGNSSGVGYGITGNMGSGGTVVFGCGECHPTDASKHMDGTVEVALYDQSAGGLKSLTPSNAAYIPGPTVLTDTTGLTYTEGTCTNIYCHSANNVVSSSSVSDAKVDAAGNPILDTNGNLTYDPYTVNTIRSYKTVQWSGAALTCSGCHSAPPRTNYPAVQAGVGQSHSWIDNYGYEDLHNWNMGYDPLSCRTCHYGTVQAANTATRDANDIATLSDVPIANAGSHVNGQVDVAFDTVDPVVYAGYSAPVSFNLAGTTYNAADKTCSNSPCHLQQKSPQWGKPYRWWVGQECDSCHHYSTWPSAPSAPSGGKAPAAPAANHPGEPGTPCSQCHQGHK